MAKSVKTSSDELYVEFLELLGEYIVWTASTEADFIAFLQFGTRDIGAGPVALWFQSTSTRGRLEMVRNYFRARFPDGDATKNLERFIERFKGLTRQRNFFCHARYHTLPDGWRATGYQITDNVGVIKETEKRINRATCNEIARLTRQLADLNYEMNAYLKEYEKRLLERGVLARPLLNTPEQLDG